MITLSAEEYKKKYGEANYNSFDRLGDGLTLPKENSQQGIMSDTFSDVKQIGTDIRNSFNTRQNNISNASGMEQGLASKTFQNIGQGFGFAGDVGGSVIKGGVKAVLPQSGEDSLKNTIASATTPIMNSKPVQDLMTIYNSLDIETQRNLDATLNIGSLLTEAFGVGVGAKGVNVATRVAKEGIEQSGRGIVEAGRAVKNTTSGVFEVARPAINAIKDTPLNIKTNLQSAKAFQDTVMKLPPTAQSAVRKGVDLEDLTKTLSINKAQKPALEKLYTGVKDFVAGKTKLNPIEAVGKPVVTRFNILKAQTKGLGIQLDEVAGNLKGKTVKGRQAVVNTVDETLAKLGISKTDKGLDFIGSNLEGLGADEKIIGNIYRRLQEATDANDFHRLKKYIDNNVNFGKTSGGFTGEAESLIKGWRKAIDSRLDLEFPAYNKVNTELAQRLKPINDFKKFMKSATGLDEDLMNMSAGQLMRRIASNVRSNPEIRQVLRDLDNATKVKGKVSGNIEALVDFYATLEKYYPEIVGKNTFQGQIKNALETSGGVLDKATNIIKSVAGQSEAVKRKAITDFLDDYFGASSFNKGAVPTTATKGNIVSRIIDRAKNTPNKKGGFIRIGKDTPKTVQSKPKVSVSESLPTNLITEAKKYKTSEEFVKAQGTPMFRGQGKKGSDVDFNTTGFQGNTEGGVFFTPTKDTARKYGDNVIERISNNKNTVSIKESDELQIMATKQVESDIKNRIESDELIEQMALGRPKAFTEYTNKPFIETGDGFGEVGELIYYKEFDKSPVTKSQLEQIWKDSNKK